MKYKRVLLKLSGEALAGDKKTGFDEETCIKVARQVKELTDNGVEVGIDEAWENEYGPIMYPGDPNADPANVYNCRCSIRAHVKGFKK